MDNLTLRLNVFETEIAKTKAFLAKEQEAAQEQFYIDNIPIMDVRLKLKSYQGRLEKELIALVTCYFLAPAGIFKLESDKIDKLISGMGNIPIAGQFLKIFTSIFSCVNMKHRLYKINHLSELFTSLNQINQVCCTFARKMTITQQAIIEQDGGLKHQNGNKIMAFFEKVKEALDHPGVRYAAEDKLALLDVTYLLEQILSGKVTINKDKDLALQFIEIVTGATYPTQRKTVSNHNAGSVPAEHELQVRVKIYEEALRKQGEEFEQYRKAKESEFEQYRKTEQAEKEKLVVLACTATQQAQSARTKGLSAEDLTHNLLARLSAAEAEIGNLKRCLLTDNTVPCGDSLLITQNKFGLTGAAASMQGEETQMLMHHHVQIRRLSEITATLEEGHQVTVRTLAGMKDKSLEKQGQVERHRLDLLQDLKASEERKRQEEERAIQQQKLEKLDQINKGFI